MSSTEYYYLGNSYIFLGHLKPTCQSYAVYCRTNVSKTLGRDQKTVFSFPAYTVTTPPLPVRKWQYCYHKERCHIIFTLDLILVLLYTATTLSSLLNSIISFLIVNTFLQYVNIMYSASATQVYKFHQQCISKVMAGCLLACCVL